MKKNETIKPDTNKTKLFTGIFVAFMVVLSFIVAWIMAGNFNQDISKLRYKLTQEYKEIKDADYSYNAEIGKKIYINTCSKCHGISGEGNLQSPPLKKSNIIKNRPDLALKIIVKGLQGKIERDGKTYNSIMPNYNILPHEDIAHVLNYIRINFQNIQSGPIHHVEAVKARIDTLSIEGTLTPQHLK